MDTIIRNVRDIDQEHRCALEEVLGHTLRDDQQIVVRVVDTTTSVRPQGENPPAAELGESQAAVLPDWCRVLEGMSDEELADFDATLSQRPILSRGTD